MIVKAVSYELTDPTIDSQMITLKASGANVFFDASSPKFAAQAIRKAFELDWQPTYFLSLTGQSIPAVLARRSREGNRYYFRESKQDPSDPTVGKRQRHAGLFSVHEDLFSRQDPTISSLSGGYSLAQSMLYILERCGDNLTRDNVMYQATHMQGVDFPMLLPGIKVSTSPTNYRGYNQLQLEKFDGKRWAPFGEFIWRIR